MGTGFLLFEPTVGLLGSGNCHLLCSRLKLLARRSSVCYNVRSKVRRGTCAGTAVLRFCRLGEYLYPGVGIPAGFDQGTNHEPRMPQVSREEGSKAKGMVQARNLVTLFEAWSSNHWEEKA